MTQQPSLDTPDVSSIATLDYAVQQDKFDPLATIRSEFLIPSKAQLQSRTLPTEQQETQDHNPCIYLCGNSLGLQPKLTSLRIQQYLSTWASQGVFGHFKPIDDSPLPTWLNADEEASRRIAPIVGASPSEVAIMETLTANLHFLMSAFYQPDAKARHKIILESKAFPSDHYAVESQIRFHGLSVSDSMVTIEPPPDTPLISTQYILSVIDEHADSTALLLLPGIQFYTGQFLDIPTITKHAQSKGIFVIWDLAHAVGNVPLQLHDWNVDAAAWCSYKYLNAGPGTIGGMFVHERNGKVSDGEFKNRLSGWWGSSKSSRFNMTNHFEPSEGAAGFQLSNPSIFDITSLCASLEVFEKAGGMGVLRAKSLKLTGYLEKLLNNMQDRDKFQILTSSNEKERGAQLSVKLESGLLDVVMKELEDKSVVLDERKPDVIRIAPAPLYNSFQDVLLFVDAFREALKVAIAAKRSGHQAEGTTELLQTT